MRLLLLFTALGLLVTPVSRGDTTSKEFEQTAAELSFFALDDFLYDRPPRARMPPAYEAQQHSDRLDRLIHGRANVDGNTTFLSHLGARVSPTEIQLLLQHENPKVRTLAMAWLIVHQGHKALPLLAEYVSDEAETFPTFQLAAFRVSSLPARAPLKTQTVGQIARGMVDFYMERAGYFYGIEGKSGNPGFREYWEQRREREHSLSWFAVKLDRATQGTSPLPDGAESRIRRVRQEINALPPVEREVALLALFAEPVTLRGIVSEQELVFAGRRLGPDRLLRLLRGEAVIDDPDLPHYQDRICNFILSHSAELLRPSDAPWLISQGTATRKVDWFLAAAHLQPESAFSILRRAFQECGFLGDERSRAATALWQLAGPPSKDFLVEWFWSDEEPKLGRAPYRAGFIDFLTKRFGQADRALLCSLIQDPRFKQLDWQTLESLLTGLNRNLLHPVVPHDEIERTRHPSGKAHFHGMIERAREEYPEETAELLATLDRWRGQVRERLKDWEPAAE